MTFRKCSPGHPLGCGIDPAREGHRPQRLGRPLPSTLVACSTRPSFLRCHFSLKRTSPQGRVPLYSVFSCVFVFWPKGKPSLWSLPGRWHATAFGASPSSLCPGWLLMASVGFEWLGVARGGLGWLRVADGWGSGGFGRYRELWVAPDGSGWLRVALPLGGSGTRKS